MFCKDCGAQNPDNAKYCVSCGKQLSFIAESLSYQSQNPYEDTKGNYNRGVRVLSFSFGALILLGSLASGSGLAYYFESGIQLVLICEVIIILMSIFLILLGAVPDYVKKELDPWIDIERRYVVVVAITILLIFIVVGSEPEPPVGWINYNSTLY